MDVRHLSQLKDLYRGSLLEDVIPFWLKHGVDESYGGFVTCLDRDGSWYCDDKYGWQQGRSLWVFSRLYNRIGPHQEWLRAARQIADFLRAHCFHPNGRMYFRVTRDGRPVYRPWSIYSEVFAIMGLAEYGTAIQDQAALNQAAALFRKIVRWLETEAESEDHGYAQTRRIAPHAVPMVLLCTAQELEKHVPNPDWTGAKDMAITRILEHHVHPEHQAVFENVTPDGKLLLNLPEGRCLNPGHALESAWFLLLEGKARSDTDLIRRAGEMIDWSLARGWDAEHGGILYFVDSEGRPPEQLEWDQKLWWVHCEALYATALSAALNGRQDHWDWFEKLHDYTWSHFPDPGCGEWLGYLHREGHPALYLKGSGWKGPFHLSRMLLLCSELFGELAKG